MLSLSLAINRPWKNLFLSFSHLIVNWQSSLHTQKLRSRSSSFNGKERKEIDAWWSSHAVLDLCWGRSHPQLWRGHTIETITHTLLDSDKSSVYLCKWLWSPQRSRWSIQEFHCFIFNGALLLLPQVVVGPDPLITTEAWVTTNTTIITRRLYTNPWKGIRPLQDEWIISPSLQRVDSRRLLLHASRMPFIHPPLRFGKMRGPPRLIRPIYGQTIGLWPINNIRLSPHHRRFNSSKLADPEIWGKGGTNDERKERERVGLELYFIRWHNRLSQQNRQISHQRHTSTI